MTRQNKFGIAFIVCFLLPFAGVGAFCLYIAAQRLITGVDVQRGWMALAAGVAFGGVGFGGLYLLFRGIPTIGQIEALKQAHPKEPWLWRPQWTNGRILSNTPAQAKSFWAIAILWNAVSCPIFFVLPEEWAKGNKLGAIGLVFPLAGAWLLWKAMSETYRVIKFGRSLLVLQTFPGVIGGSLKGTIQTGRAFPSDSVFRLKLLCINRTQSGSGKNSSTWEKTLWEEEQREVRAQAALQAGFSTVPLAFALPLDSRASDNETPGNEIIWRLEITSAVPGLDFKTQFEVPVFETEDSYVAAAQTPKTPPVVAYLPDDTSDVRVSSTLSGGKEFFYPSFRHPGVAAVVFFFTLIFGGATGFWYQVHAPLVVVVLCGLLTLLFVWITLGLIFGQTRVVMESGTARVEKSLLGFKTGTRSAAAMDLKSVQMKIGMQSGEKVYYDLQLIRHNGRKINAGSSIRNKREAEWIVAEMTRLLNLPKS